MSYSNYQLNQRINNLQQQINSGGSGNLQSVLDSGNSATDTNIILQSIAPITDQTIISQGFINLINSTSQMLLNQDEIQFTNSSGEATIAQSTDNLNLTSTNINLYGQASFDTPPHSVSPILGNDLTTKGYVDSLVGQYSGGFNLYLNYSETLTVNSISYKKLSHTVSSAVQQSVITTTDGTNQLIASFISDAINITQIPAGLWNMVLYGGISAIGGVVYYFFKIRKNSGGVITDLITSGNSIDINATPSTNPDAYHMNATIDTPITVLLTDRIIIEVYCIKISGANVNLTTYFESSYYSYIQTTLNAGTTLLSSNNNWLGDNTFNGKLIGANGCIAGQTNYITINTSALPQTISTTTNLDMFVFLVGSTALKVLNIPVPTYLGQRIQIKNTATVDVSIAFPTSNVMLFDSIATSSAVVLKSKGVISLYWGSAFWMQTVPYNILPDLTTSGFISTPTLNALADTSNLGICSTQSTGVLNLCVGARSKSNGTGEGNINIGTGINTITSGTSGPSINIGNNASTLNRTEINIGSTNTKTTINGPLTIAGATSAVDYTGSGFITTPGNISTTGTGSITSASTITSATGITASGGNITASTGNILGQILRNNLNTGSISVGGVINGTSLTISTSPTTFASISASGVINGTGITTTGAITLPTIAYTPTTGQLGYVVTGTSIASPVFPISGNTTSFMSVVLTIGTWLVFASRQFTAGTSTTAVFFGLGKILRSSNGIASTDSEYGISSPPLSTISTYGHVSGVVSLTASTTIYLNINTTYTGTAPTTATTYALMNAVRIA
jgi:hypothetical protein